MSRTVSLPFMQAAFAQETGEAPVILITIDHASLGTPIRVAGYDVDIVSNGDTYVAFPFEITLPTDLEEGAPRAKLSIDNIDRSIVIAIRTASGLPPTCTMQIVLASTPNTVEASFPSFTMRNVSYSAETVEAELVLDALTSEPFPAGKFRQGAFPGIF